MYMKVATVEIAPGKMDEYLRLFQAAQVPALKAARGFQEARLLTDAHTGKVMVDNLMGDRSGRKGRTSTASEVW